MQFKWVGLVYIEKAQLSDISPSKSEHAKPGPTVTTIAFPCSCKVGIECIGPSGHESASV